MKGIFLARITSFIRNPWIFVLFTGMSLIFTLIVGNFSGSTTKVTVPVAGDAALQRTMIWEMLEVNEVYSFQWQDREVLEEKVRRGDVEAGVLLKEDGYEMMVGIQSPNVQLIEQTVQEVYVEKLREENIVELFSSSDTERDGLLEDYRTAKENPIFTINDESFQSDDTFLFDSGLHSIFGFTLFFVIYTIGYTVVPILMEKKGGIWDRMILSPLKRWEMYTANLIYSFFEGYMQIIIIFLFFRFAIGVDFNGELPGILLVMSIYTFAIVALMILIVALVKNIQQFNAVLPIVSVSMAMIGGAFWPIEIVESEILLALSKVNPLTYALEALNGLVLYNWPWEDVLMPVSILVLMGVFCIGIGIHLMERRHIQ